MKATIVTAIILNLAIVFSADLVFSATSTDSRQCVRNASVVLRELKAAARSCGNAKDNVIPLRSMRTNILVGSADDLFSLSLDKIGATTEDLAQIALVEAEIMSRRDTMLNDVAIATDEALNSSTEPCAEYSKRNTAYNSLVASCSRAVKQKVVLSCSVSIRYSKKDLTAATKRCTKATNLATKTPANKTSTLAQIDAELAKGRKYLAAATDPAYKKELQDGIDELTAERAMQAQYFDQAISLINAQKNLACNASKSAKTSYDSLVKSCKK